MTHLRWRALAAVVIVAGTVSAVGLRWWTSRGHLPVTVPLMLALVLLTLAVLVLVLGLRVRSAVRAHALDDPIGASRILVLGQAGAVTAAIHVGYFLAQIALALPHVSAPEPHDQVLRCVAGILGAVALGAAGLLTQHWCRIPPEDDDDDGTGPSGPSGPGASGSS